MRAAASVSFAVIVAAVAVAGLRSQGPLPQVAPLRGGCGAAPRALQMSPPLLGASCRFAAAPPPGAWTAVFWSLPVATPLALPGGCVAWLDANGLELAAFAGPDVPEVEVPIPNDPSWLGVPLHAQVALLPAATAPGFELTTALQFAVGERRGPLQGLPSPPGPHVAAIAAMPLGSWLDLGVPAPDPTFGLATGREYTPRLSWSDSLGGAFLTGESGHGYVNPNTGRYVDDVWFYDLAGHAWRCVKPGSEVATLSLSLNQDQFEVDAQGELVPVAQLGHGYEFVAFDERHQRFLMQPMPNTYWANAMPQRLGWLPSANFPASQYRSPWLFDTVAGRWLRQPTGALAPNFQTGSRATVVHGFGDGRFLYFDAHPANQHRVWWFDAATLSWQDEATASAGPAISGHGVSCLDRARGRLWFYGVDAATQKARLWCYDAHNRRWTDPQAVGTPQHTVIYTTSDRGMTYDAERDLVLLKVGQGGTTPSEFHAYDVALGVWRPPVSPPAALGVNWNWRHINACYAAGYDVHVLHVAPGNSGTGRIVLYRAP